MKDAPNTAVEASERPEFLWDPKRARHLWANTADLKVWGEYNVADLSNRLFAPGGAITAAISSLKSTGYGPAQLPSTGVR